MDRAIEIYLEWIHFYNNVDKSAIACFDDYILVVSKKIMP